MLTRRKAPSLATLAPVHVEWEEAPRARICGHLPDALGLVIGSRSLEVSHSRFLNSTIIGSDVLLKIIIILVVVKRKIFLRGTRGQIKILLLKSRDEMTLA